MKATAFFIGGAFAFGGNSTLAQTIVPDATLGLERSVVTPGVDVGGVPADRIEGGAVRGTNLFHSFSQFNVGEFQRVYFANPSGIINILTRVTGNNLSNILGTLGVTGGNANLFLINPNGIIFGPNARLDIDGSFFASTASSFKFPDGSEFSATNPTAPPLLTVNVTPGVQWGASSPGATITNRGNLAPGQDLTLFADKLDLQGQLQAGRDLTLLALSTVQVRDSVTTGFLAQAGRHLTVQGNQGIDILALNHPTQIPFVSRGNLSLISDGIISGDARFSSGGSFSIRSVSGGLANMVSEHDPIISAQGDVDVAANYTGTSLLVEATGNIRFQGDINITGPDTSTLPDGPDTATLSSGSALIMRSGQSTLAYGGVNSGGVPVSGTGVVPEGITIGGNVDLQPSNEVGGIVTLTAASGDVNTKVISTNGQQDLPEVDPFFIELTNDTNGGTISLFASNGSITTGDLYSWSYSQVGIAANGGAISLFANGSISTGNLYSFSSSDSGNAGNGGNINLTAANDITITGDLYSFSSSNSGNTGNRGNINLTAANDIAITGDLYSSSSSDSGNAGNGGDINLTAANDITIPGDIDSSSSFYSGNAGNGGNINLTAANDITIPGDFFSSSSSDSGNAGNGGNINLTAANDITIPGDFDSQSYGNFDSQSSSNSGNAGNGGNIRLTAANGRITFPPYSVFFRSPSIDASGANGGNITLTSPAGIFELKDFSINSNASNGNGGNIQINATSVSLTNTEVTTTARGRGNPGNISIVAEGNVSLDFSRLFTSLEFDGTGKGGDITIEAQAVSLNNSSFIDTATFGQGNAGNVFIKADDDVLLDTNSAIFSITAGVGNGGNVRVEAGEAVSLANRSNISTAVNRTAVGNGGDIDIKARALSLTGGSQLVTSSSSSGKAGNITVHTTEGVTIWGIDPNFTPTQPLNVSVGNPPPLAEEEPNNEIAQAQPLTQFFLNSPDDVNPLVELSTRIPYVSISGTSMDTSDFYSIYSFEVTAGTRAIFDIDTFVQGGGRLPLLLYLSDSVGNELALASYSSPSQGAGGSTTTDDPYLRYAFSEPGTYFISVGLFDEGNYTLNVSLDTPSVATSVVNGTLPSGLFARTEGAGAAGKITINTPQLSVTDGGNVSATATAAATSTAKGGNIDVNASQVNLQGNTSGLFAQTQGAAPAGSLRLQPYNNGQSLAVNLQQGAQISASTNGSGQGGTLTITAPESITLSGNGSIISAEASGSGTGGDLTLDTGTLTIRDEAKVTVSSTGTGNAGNLNITAYTLQLDNGQLIAQTASGEGGNIKLQVQDLLLMRRNSLISTSAGTASAGGNGGNITINAPFVVAIPIENSDIRANAYTGTGGRVDITANGIFGLQLSQEDTPLSDITASSEYGVQGTVTLNTPNVDPSRGLTNLPTEVVDASNQIAQNCRPGRAAASKQSSFVVTGRGGLPPNPTEALNSDNIQADWVSLTPKEANPSTPAVSNHPTSATPAPLVEAQGWVINEKGQVLLTATAPTVTPHSSWHKPMNCDAPQAAPGS